MRSRRHGSTLLLVLVVITMLGVTALSGRSAAALSLRSIQNRHAIVRAEYTADGCLARWAAQLEDRMRNAATSEAADSMWSTVASSSGAVTASCALDSRAAGGALDVNTAPSELLGPAIATVAPGRESAWLDRLQDWRDEDDVARPLGGERLFYHRQHHGAPANRDFESNAELLLALSGEVAPERVLQVLGVEHAPLWSGSVAAKRLAEHDLFGFQAVPLPVAWTLRAAFRGGLANACVSVEWRVVRYGTRIDVDARRLVLPGEIGTLTIAPICR